MRPRHHASLEDVVQVRSATDVTEDHLYYRANEEPFEYPARHGSTDEERDSNHRRPSQPYSSQSVEAPGQCSTARTRATVRRVVVDPVERIASRNDRAPQQQRRNNEKHHGLCTMMPSATMTPTILGCSINAEYNSSAMYGVVK